MPVTGLKKVGKIKTEVICKIDENGTVEHAQLLFLKFNIEMYFMTLYRSKLSI